MRRYGLRQSSHAQNSQSKNDGGVFENLTRGIVTSRTICCCSASGAVAVLRVIEGGRKGTDALE